MEAKNIKINKNSVDITLSISVNEWITTNEAINKLLQVVIDNGKLKIVDRHTFC